MFINITDTDLNSVTIQISVSDVNKHTVIGFKSVQKCSSAIARQSNGIELLIITVQLCSQSLHIAYYIGLSFGDLTSLGQNY